MRALTRLSLVVGLAALTGTAMARTIYVAADDSKETHLCVSAAMASPIQFYRDVSESGYNLRSVSNGITCNNAAIASFAHAAGNTRNARSLMRVFRGEGTVEVRDAAALSTTTGIDLASAEQIVYIKGGK